MIHIDGAQGEGGGQIVRTSLALSMVTGRPVTIDEIRARRKRPGLANQHLTAVEAAAAVCGAEVAGAKLGSRRLVFQPGPVQPGEYLFDVGTAGSTTLVLQTVLPPLLTAEAPSQLTLRGGTHNMLAPPFDFLERVYAPLLRKMGPQLDLKLHRRGFYPVGGGEMTARITPAPALRPLSLLDRGKLIHRRVEAVVARLPRHIAQREIDVVRKKSNWRGDQFHIVELNDCGPGNVLMIELAHEQAVELCTSFGRRGVPAERVAAAAYREALAYLDSGTPVGEHLADQLLLPQSLAAHQGAGGGAFRTAVVSGHTRTHIDVIARFLDVAIEVDEQPDGTATIRVEAGKNTEQPEPA